MVSALSANTIFKEWLRHKYELNTAYVKDIYEQSEYLI